MAEAQHMAKPIFSTLFEVQFHRSERVVLGKPSVSWLKNILLQDQNPYRNLTNIEIVRTMQLQIT